MHHWWWISQISSGRDRNSSWLELKGPAMSSVTWDSRKQEEKGTAAL